MWAKYKFYIIGAAALIVAILLYKKYGKKTENVVQQETENPASKLVSSGTTVGDSVALSRAFNFVR